VNWSAGRGTSYPRAACSTANCVVPRELGFLLWLPQRRRGCYETEPPLKGLETISHLSRHSDFGYVHHTRRKIGALCGPGSVPDYDCSVPAALDFAPDVPPCLYPGTSPSQARLRRRPWRHKPSCHRKGNANLARCDFRRSLGVLSNARLLGTHRSRTVSNQSVPAAKDTSSATQWVTEPFPLSA